jgi:hypothetical protein
MIKEDLEWDFNLFIFFLFFFSIFFLFVEKLNDGKNTSMMISLGKLIQK